MRSFRVRMSILRLWLPAQSPLQVAERLLEALIEVHPVHEQHQALLVAGAPSSSAAKSAIQLSGTSPKSAVVVNILLTPLVVENDICSARVQTRDL